MRDDVFPERILEVLCVSGQACIDVDPPIAYERAPLEISVCFEKPAINTAAAREQIGVDWDFGDGLKGKGWSVCHYFQVKPKWLLSHYFPISRKQKGYKLRVTFRDPDDKPLTNTMNQLI